MTKRVNVAKNFAIACTVVASAVLCMSANAEDGVRAYPDKPIRLVVPYAPGGGSDLIARKIGQRLTMALRQQVVIDNRAGAGGVVGHNTVAKANPDGYTLLLGNASGLVINPLLSSNTPYDPVKDFAPISMAVIGPLLLVVNPQIAINTVKELIAFAKAKPRFLNFASAGNGTGNHLAGELFKSMAGIDMVHVPYKGSGLAVSDVVAGHVQLMFNTIPSLLPLAKANKLRMIAVTSVNRMALLPEVPALAETLPGYQCVLWYALLAPAGTSHAIIKKLNAEMVAALNAPDVVQLFAAEGAQVQSSTPQRLSEFIAEDRARWKGVITSARLAGESVR